MNRATSDPQAPIEGATATVSRDNAAEILWRARQADPSVDATAIDWAYAVLPECRAAQRLKARALICRGLYAEAQGLLAIGLLQRPTDPALALLRARCHMRMGEADAAAREIRIALRQRPDHVETLEEAAGIATALVDHTNAAELLARAHRLSPTRTDLTESLIESLLNLEHLDRVASLLGELPAPPLSLEVRYLRARGRQVEALALLDGHLADETCDSRRDALLEMMIDLLEETGQWTRVIEQAIRLNSRSPRALIRAARAVLSIGRSDLANALLNELPRAYDRAPSVLAARTVAEALSGEGHDSSRVATARTGGGPAIDMRLMAATWRRGLQGGLIRRHSTSTTASSDPNPSLLRPLLRRALRTLDRAGIAGTASLSDAELADHAARCRSILGKEAIEAA